MDVRNFFERKNARTQERKNARTQERKNARTQERKNDECKFALAAVNSRAESQLELKKIQGSASDCASKKIDKLLAKNTSILIKYPSQ